MKREETARLQRYLQKTFRLDTIELRPMMRKDDMLEVFIAGESAGLIYRDVDEDDGEVSYSFRMVMLEIDLADV
ncbi:MAG: DUF3126 family protein [Rhizobiales bacterium]|nr:DUF3126 family protein [Hyphomicrobiales bacterium]